MSFSFRRHHGEGDEDYSVTTSAHQLASKEDPRYRALQEYMPIATQCPLSRAAGLPWAKWPPHKLELHILYPGGLLMGFTLCAMPHEREGMRRREEQLAPAWAAYRQRRAREKTANPGPMPPRTW